MLLVHDVLSMIKIKVPNLDDRTDFFLRPPNLFSQTDLKLSQAFGFM